jgi:hypothetical protein
MKHPQKGIALVLLAAMGLSPASGCLSVGIESVGKPATGVETGSLEVSVFQHRPRNGNGDLPEHPLVSELSRLEGSKEIAIRETSESRWNADGLRPGRYRIRVARFIDEGGKTRPLSSPVQETFHVRPGETVSAEIVVKRFPTATVFGLGAAAAGGVLLAAVISAATSWSGSSGRSLSISGKGKHKKLLDTQPMPAPQAAPIPSALRP